MNDGPLSAATPFKKIPNPVREVLSSLTSASIFNPVLDSIAIPKHAKTHLVGIGKSAPQDIFNFLKACENKKIEIIIGEILILCLESSLSNFELEKEAIIFPGDHPVPTARNIENSQKLIDHLAKIPSEEGIIFFISGGTSALFEVPAPGSSLDEIIELNQSLLKSGLDIYQMNRKRCQLSLVKNGGLLKFLKAEVLGTLVSCDLPGDDITWVGSAPTFNHDHLTKNPPLNAFLSFKNLLSEMRTRYPTYRELETPFIGTSQKFLETVYRHLKGQRGLFLVGEPTVEVTIDRPGKGGRCAHHAALLGIDLIIKNRLGLSTQELKGLRIMALATDGKDGNSAAAGAYFRGRDILGLGKDIERSLLDFDCGSFFSQKGLEIPSMNTGLNLMDLFLIDFS